MLLSFQIIPSNSFLAILLKCLVGTTKTVSCYICISFRNANPNDISLIELEEPLNFTDRVKPIALPAEHYETTGLAIASGWGQTGGNLVPILPNILQYAELPIPSGEGNELILILMWFILTVTL